MDPDANINKLINFLKRRGFVKEANILEDVFTEPEQKKLITDCPICGPTKADSNCILCDGTGEIVSIVPDDTEDERVIEELKLKK